MRIGPDGTQELIRQQGQRLGEGDTDPRRYLTEGSLPNGITFARNGDLIIANFGTDAIERMTRDGHSRTLFTEIDGAPLGGRPRAALHHRPAPRNPPRTR